MPDELIPPPPTPTYAFIANGDVLYTRQFDLTPFEEGWRLVVDTPKPMFDADTQECVQTGWSITDTTATQTWTVLDKPSADAPVVTVAPSDVPNEVPMWAVRDLIESMGLLSQVDAMIEAIPDAAARRKTRNQWQYGNFIVRSHPMILALGAQLGFTEAQVDDLFRQASQLK